MIKDGVSIRFSLLQQRQNIHFLKFYLENEDQGDCLKSDVVTVFYWHVCTALPGSAIGCRFKSAAPSTRTYTLVYNNFLTSLRSWKKINLFKLTSLHFISRFSCYECHCNGQTIFSSVQRFIVFKPITLCL